jgi:hypothetical protein
VVGSLLNVTEPRVYIEVGEPSGRTTEQAADAIAADYAGFEIARSSATIGGQDAIVLDGVPGQDISRQLVVAHEDAGEVYQRMERLYATVVDSLTFAP